MARCRGGDHHPTADVHYGAVNLKGKDTRQRALAIIELTHPSFRDNLIQEADMVGII